MTEPDNVVDTAPAEAYKESDEHVPDATAAFGTLDTTGTAGGQNERIEHITPLFDAARAQDLQYAAAALDPNDDSVIDPGAVVNEGQQGTVTIGGGRSHEEGEDAVKEAAAAAEANPVKVQDPSVTDAAKAKKDGTSTSKTKVEAEQKKASATNAK